MSSDDDDPAVRYGQQLQSLRKKLAGMQTSANSPTGGKTVPLPATRRDSGCPFEHDSCDVRERRDREREQPSSPSSSWIPGADAPDWTLQAQYAQPDTLSFPYDATGIGAVPPHAQPLSDVHNLHPRESISIANSVANNLGFATLDDWFSNPAGYTNLFEELDLADFWMKVGPGEAQAGFPFQ